MGKFRNKFRRVVLLQKTVAAPAPATQPDNPNSEAEGHPLAGSENAPSTTPQKKTKPRYKVESTMSWLKRTITFKGSLEFIATAVGIYVAFVYHFQLVQMKISNDISSESLQSVQRAYISEKMQITNAAFADDNVRKMSTSALWTNDGATPAVNINSSFNVIDLPPGGPNESQFLGSAYPYVGTSAFSYMAPRNSAPSGIKEITEKDLFGDDYPNIDTHNPVVLGQRKVFTFWGWIRYNDVFTNTPVRITEFCQSDAVIQIPEDRSANPKFEMTPCPEHNCEDQYCKDYQAVVDFKMPSGLSKKK